MSYWYHFIIMFEALFILTLLETGTRVARFVFQEAATTFTPRAVTVGKPRWGMNILSSAVVCVAWGYLLYTGMRRSVGMRFAPAFRLCFYW